MDEHPVTVAEFRRFVKATGYVTTAEVAPDPRAVPGRGPGPARTRVAGVHAAAGTCSPRRPHTMVVLHPRRDWRHPEVPAATSGGAGNGIPSRTCRGSTPRHTPTGPARTCRPRRSGNSPRGGWARPQALRVGGDEHEPGGRPGGNVWQGEFPWQNLLEDGFAGTSPVGHFRSNGYRLHDMAGNVWSGPPTTSRRTTPRAARTSRRRRRAAFRPIPPGGQCGRPRPAGAVSASRHQGRLAPVRTELLSALPAAARQGETEETSTSHIGFRCILRP